MICFVSFALNAAGLTNLGAQPTKILRKLGIATHQRGRLPAHICAISIEPNALRHLGDIVLAQACISTHLAGLGALCTSFNASAELFDSHFENFVE